MQFKTKVKNFFLYFQRFVDQPWYEWVLSLLICLDIFFIIIPSDGLIISSALLRPSKWWRIAAICSIGSTLGIVLFAWFLQIEGLPFLLHFFPHLLTSEIWTTSQDLFKAYGLLLLFFVSAVPIVIQPTLALAILGGHSLMSIFAIVFMGRLIKFFAMTGIVRFAPEQISRFWGRGIKKELIEVGVKLEKK